MKIELAEEYRSIMIKEFDIDIEDYVDWLNGEEPTEDNLVDYIYETGIDPSSVWEDVSDCINSYINDAKKLFETLNNE